MSDENEQISIALNDAAAKGDIEAAKAALAAGADVHYSRDLALRSAARESRVEMLHFLVREAGADVHALNDEALRHAAKNNREAAVEALLELGANANVMDGDPLIQAATKGFNAVAKSLLKHSANPHFSDDQALRQAAFNGHLPVVITLAQNKADLFSMRGSAAALAANEKHEAIVNFLAENMQRERAEFLGTLSLMTTVKRFLKSDYRHTGESAFIRAVKMNCLDEAVKKLKDAGETLNAEDLDLRDRNGRPLGWMAAEFGKLNKLLDADLWRGSLEEVQSVWEKIPPSVRKSSGMTEEDFAGVIASFHQRALKEKAGKIRLKF